MSGQSFPHEYFGELSCWTKTMATASTFGIFAFRYFKTGYMKIFYTDDYPRASLSVMSAALVFSTLLSLFVEPLLAWLSAAPAHLDALGPLQEGLVVQGAQKPLMNQERVGLQRRMDTVIFSLNYHTACRRQVKLHLVGVTRNPYQGLAWSNARTRGKVAHFFQHFGVTRNLYMDWRGRATEREVQLQFLGAPRNPYRGLSWSGERTRGYGLPPWLTFSRDKILAVSPLPRGHLAATALPPWENPGDIIDCMTL
ncbi:hypothetical protein AK812_SmicGene36920 [Symbiodinium microadriaticum]|uniref:Uncharacterized protein n=1 Tax=Symbiodinium microadriaticum TaxID=2951 RepID=A0A1Q9CHM9_SYMMI|nr:hypothetical protein AK812_SmicGene36920 [Symbiodinium microadriaticum]